ncbi:unnamed protein product [Cuscuta epithymum]|uniref:Homeobox domain-containing protein n=1 Tax=Cuscuta epithymum TaxID=186058 RepID=A0AAV0G238_9ASTE|nr:unnamed protein product [Cuscuta epithymum]
MASQESPNSCHQFGNQSFSVYPSDRYHNHHHPCQSQFPSFEFLGGDRIGSSSPPLLDQNTTHHFMDLLGQPSNEATHHSHKLSLSLGTVQFNHETSLNQMNPMFMNPGIERFSSDYSLSDSKYLRPALSLLEEVASVGGLSTHFMANEKSMWRAGKNNGAFGIRSNQGIDQVPTNDVEAKIMRLVAMLEEVERRYKRYYHQMEELVSSYEVISGKSYTALALEAMSKYFFNLRDAIISQINAITRKASESKGMSLFQDGETNFGIQKLSLQHLGMIQSSGQPWRPIRGLPETSVATLRAWLFQHFLHPYPNDSEKLMLASQTGLSKNQISNWFINARVRLWKPMIEEMYRVEFAEASSADDESGDPSLFLGGGVTPAEK